MKTLSKISTTLFWLSAVSILLCNYLIFCYVPDEKAMGAIQRIFYFHVAAASSCYFAFGVCLFASVSYLASGKKTSEILASASVEVGFLLCSITLITGMIWGYSAWNTVFNFEPRLVSFLMMWLIFLSYLIIRNSIGNPRISSIVGIIGGASIVPVIYSVKLLEKSKQLHPQVLERSGLTPEMKDTLMLSLVAIFIFTVYLIINRYRLGILEEEK